MKNLTVSVTGYFTETFTGTEKEVFAYLKAVKDRQKIALNGLDKEVDKANRKNKRGSYYRPSTDVIKAREKTAPFGLNIKISTNATT